MACGYASARCGGLCSSHRVGILGNNSYRYIRSHSRHQADRGEQRRHLLVVTHSHGFSRSEACKVSVRRTWGSEGHYWERLYRQQLWRQIAAAELRIFASPPSGFSLLRRSDVSEQLFVGLGLVWANSSHTPHGCALALTADSSPNLFSRYSCARPHSTPNG